MPENQPEPGFLEFLPVSFFGAVMATAGLSAAFGWAEKMFGLPAWIAQSTGWLSLLIFVLLTIAYIIKWIRFPKIIATEFDHPVSISFFGTFFISLLLIPGILLPYSVPIAVSCWILGAVCMFFFAWIVLRKWLDHQQDPKSAMPAWIIPIVGTLDVPIVGYRLPIAGIHEICSVFFGIGIVFTVLLMTIIVSRLIFQPSLPEALQPTLLILIGPFALAFSGYESLTGVQDMAATVFYYFSLFFLLIIGSKIIYLPRCCPFRVTWWSVGFPLVAITIASFRYTSHKTAAIYKIVPAALLILSTVTIMYLLLLTVYKIFTHTLILPVASNEKATQLLQQVVQAKS